MTRFKVEEASTILHDVADALPCTSVEVEEIIIMVQVSAATIQVATKCHIDSTTYSVTSDDNTITVDGSEFDLLLLTSVRWSSWRLSSCFEYNASDNEIESDESESEESEQEVSGSESDQRDKFRQDSYPETSSSLSSLSLSSLSISLSLELALYSKQLESLQLLSSFRSPTLFHLETISVSS